MMTSRSCTKCKAEKAAPEFRMRTRRGRTFLNSQCRACERTANNAWVAKNTERHRASERAWSAERPDRRRALHMETRYGITVEDYNALLARQEGVCAICKGVCPSGKRLAVDHDHLTNRVRGLLCVNCNQAIGHMRDNGDRLRAAADYVDAHDPVLRLLKFA